MLARMEDFVENTRRKQIAWVRAIMDYRHWNASRLAREGKFSHSTLSKFFNDPLNVARLETAIVEKIARVGGIPPYQTQPPQAARGVAQGEASAYRPVPGDGLGDAVDALSAGSNSAEAWVLHSRALESAGYLPGDVVVVDRNADPRPGDVVCAVVYDKTGHGETVVRLFEHPFLVSATLDPELLRPVLIDDDRVEIQGVVTASVRPRRVA
ncbi:hypothetical protein NA8A_04733 [Nitratireductor indicus C115]|uniref:Peptidase S24/S26A/S26B/S26C domain-containing protein n=1 Tax=Nitratireductor indicus C115 TaxID=1231190 RepID=K2N749_9HYPH|nr:S24 family peptidase [Nitratireductor indicus]EKF43308.1 hypothetical protein NA8A_04733 [Nitratireductor indicus C115]SFQ10435.1 Peptidase S24-like [Nitratireductor indicus]